MPDETPAAVLRQAAQVLRERAERATPGTWQYSHDYNYQPSVKAACGEWVAECGPVDSIAAPGGRGDHDAHWIALMSPEVAEPLARWLSDTADDFEVEQRTEPETSCDAYALDLARAIVRDVA